MVIFSFLYGVISYSFAHYGEMITYMGMTASMAIFAFFSWMNNPYQGNKAEYKEDKKSLSSVFFSLRK